MEKERSESSIPGRSFQTRPQRVRKRHRGEPVKSQGLTRNPLHLGGNSRGGRELPTPLQWQVKIGGQLSPKHREGASPSPQLQDRLQLSRWHSVGLENKSLGKQGGDLGTITPEKSFQSNQRASNIFFSFCGGEEADLFSGIPDGKLRVVVEVVRDRLQLNTGTNFLTVGMCLPSCLSRE